MKKTISLVACLLAINVLEANTTQVTLNNGSTASKVRVDEVWEALGVLTHLEYGCLYRTCAQCRRENSPSCVISSTKLNEIFTTLDITKNGNIDQETQAIICACDRGSLFKGYIPIIIDVRYPAPAHSWKEQIPFYRLWTRWKELQHIGSKTRPALLKKNKVETIRDL